MSASQAFLDAFRAQVGDIVVLVRVTPRNPTTLATAPVYLSTDVVDTPAGSVEPARVWVPLLADVGSIADPGGFVSTDLGLATTQLLLARTALDTTLLIDGAEVSVWLWDRGLKGGSFDDALCVLAGGCVIDWSCNADTISLVVRQRTDWNRDLVPVEVTPEAYPHAPEDSIGQFVPIVYGRLRDVPFRYPWPEYPLAEDTTFGLTYRGLSLLLGGRRAGAAVLVDTGRGAGATNNPKARVLVASHKCKTVADLTNGCGVYAKMGEHLVPLDPAAPGDVINTTTEAGLLIPDNTDLAWISATPVDVDVVANSAENPRALLDTFNDQNWARFDWAAGYRTVRMKMPALQDLGDMTEVYLFAGYRSVASTNLKIRLRNTSTGTTVDGALAASATRRIVMARIATAWVAPLSTNPWDFSEIELELGWPTSAPAVSGSGTGEGYFAGFVVRFKPRQELIESEKVFEHQATRPITRFPGKGMFEKTVWQPYTARDVLPAVQELLGKFFANVEGYADDGEFAAAGSFTDVAGALIERAPDMLAHQLVRYANEPLANIEQGVGAYGSFKDARALLRDPRLLDMTFALSVNQTTDVMTAISWLSQSSVSLVMLDRFTNRWRFLPWRADAPTDYPWKFRPQDIVEQALPEASRTPLTQVLTGLAMGYGYDAATKAFQHRVRLAWNGSASGHKYRGVRDEYLTVVAAVNDKLDFATSGSKVATLTAGGYDGPGYAAMLSTAMKTADATREFCVVHGVTIVTGYNDEIFYRDATAGVDRTVPLTPGVYTMEGAGAMVSAALDAANGVPPSSLTYSRSTRKFNFARAGGALWLYRATGSVKSQRLYLTLGFDNVGTTVLGGATTATGEGQRAEEFLTISCLSGALDLLWENGANGLNGLRKNCASLCGFLGLRDSNAGGATRSWLADSPKSNREALLLRTAQRYGAKRDTVEDLRAVAETDTAREVRDRLVALLGKPRMEVKFSTHAAPDIERGRVFEFSSDFDALVTYPDPDSDGLWTGKRFVVVEAEQLLGPIAFYMKIRAVALD